MRSPNFIPIVDLFAGPGGLGEGFSSLRGNPFRIIVSAEMDENAHKTLQLRAFFRAAREENGEALQLYYDFCNGDESALQKIWETSAWAEAKKEALRLTLGDAQDNRKLDSIIRKNGLGPQVPWVLIGGPPCQAYSLVGRSRNRGKTDYRPEDDHRHFLYKEYLRIIQKYRPAVFVMENVKGILSAAIGDHKIFHSVLQDLADPDLAIKGKTARTGYRIHSLSADVCFDRTMNPEDIDVTDFVVRAEEHGIPQARHRVILVGVRDDINVQTTGSLKKIPLSERPTVAQTLMDLPKLRSKISRGQDDALVWWNEVRSHFLELRTAAVKQKLTKLGAVLATSAREVDMNLTTGALRLPKDIDVKIAPRRRLNVWLNHEARGHMSSDLLRYAYASSFAQVEGRSPKGHGEFGLLEKLRPDHLNWESGKFADRFRVQLSHTVATTVTSHISKDGHYFIHYDPAQCRSLTVREAARLQTFPDNYFFQGNRTQQFHQVGNAVPPALAQQIAEIVKSLLQRAAKS